jgi:cysteine desulfurase/selenocysteine lyase
MSNTAQYDVVSIRNEFPVLNRTVHGKPLVYLDNAASSQRPEPVIDAVRNLYAHHYANIHRGVHQLSQEASQYFEEARVAVRGFIGAACVHEVIFTRGTTESINLVAQSYARPRLKKGDEILITHMEHHSNIVPWQLVCEQTGAELKVVPITDKGEMEMNRFRELLSERTRLVSVAHVSNALGTVNPVKEIIELSHSAQVPVLIDGAQAVPHIPVNVQDLDVDFYAFSGHKVYGPTGIGVLYGREALLNEMPPYQGGGDMILSVRFEGTTYNSLPYKFEAGTPNIAGAIGLGEAVRYVQKIGMEAIAAHEHELLEYAVSRLSAIDGLRMIGEAGQRAGLVSFVLDTVHAHDIGTLLDAEGVAVRAGHHCAQPVMERYGVPATARASFAMYNTFQEIDVLAEAIRKTITLFK